MSESSAQVALITGASLGIGFELARSYAARGFALVLGARDAARLAEAREALVREHPGLVIELVAGDVTDSAVQEQLCAAARALGALRVLINNAGRGYYARFADIDGDTFASLLALNVLAPLSLTQRALPALRASGGSVVMISSLAGVAVAPGMGAYAASKFALEALSAALRAEVAADGVHVLVVRPGPVATAFRRNAHSAGDERLETPTGKDNRQPAAEVAERIARAVERRRAVLETSAYVHGASLLSRSAPGLFRVVTRRLAQKRS